MSSAPITNDQLIDQRIDEARRALWWGELIRTLLTIVIGSMVAILGWLVFDHWVYASGPFLRSVSLVALIAVVTWFLVRRVWPVLTSKVTDEYAAWALEQGHSDYRQQLTSYVTLKPDGADKGLRARIVKVLGSRAAGLLKTYDELPAEATGTFRWWIAAAAVFALLMAYVVGSPKSSLASATRLIAPLSAIDPAQRVSIREVQPGDADALAGRSVAVSARVSGLREDEPVYCRWVCDGRASETEMSWDPSTGLHRGDIELPHSASGLATYRLEAGDALAGPFRLDVENVPVVAIESVYYQPPEYTGRKARTFTSPSITVIDGTNVTIQARTNRAVARAEIQFNPKQLGDTVRATAGRQVMDIAEDGTTLTAELTLRSARGKTAAVERESYRVRVWDSNEQPNPEPIVYPIRVIPDLPPEVAIVVPQKSPIEVPFSAQQIIEVHAMDADFELQEVSLKIDRGIDTLSEPLIWLRKQGESGRGNQVMEYRFRPAEHRLNVGDTVRITAIALDNREIPGDSSVEPNRSVTDPVEIRIVEDQTELPDDPSANDGLSRPDDRPASDVDQSEQSEGGQGEEQGGGGSGQQGESSGKQGSGQQGDAAQESGTPQSSESGTGQQGSSSKDSQPQDGVPPQEGDPQQGDPSQGSSGEPSGDAGDTGSGDPTPSTQSDGGNDAQNPGQTGSGEQPAGEQNMGDRDAGQPGQNDSGESNGMEQNSGQSPGDPNSARPDASNGQQGSGSDSNAPPKHDGEAFERIKDFVENKRKQDAQRQSSGGDNSTKERKGGAEQTGNDSSNSDPGDSDPNGGDKNTGDPSSDPSESPNGEREPTPPQDDQGNSQPEKGEAEGSSESGSESDPSSSTESQEGRSGDPKDESAMESGAGDREGESPSTEDGGDKQSTGEGAEESSGQNPSGEPSESSTQPSGDSQQGEPGATPESGESRKQDGVGEQNGNREQGGEQGQGEGSEQPQTGDSGSEDSQSGDGAREQPSGDSGKPRNAESGGSEGEHSSSNDSSDGQPSSNTSQNSDSAAQPSSSNPANSDASSGDGNGTGSMPGTASDAANEPPPPDLEYAKEATDMVLDYLDETREQVDPKLLEDLNWTEKDLQRFRQRWQKVRELEQAPGNTKPGSELEDALKSLGLKPKARGAGTRESADGFRSLRDSGNRRKAPPAFRDAFDAFRSRSKE
ncbi:MAG: hypothetical protein AAFU85_13225 [Planctomycetota bacterium]